MAVVITEVQWTSLSVVPQAVKTRALDLASLQPTPLIERSDPSTGVSTCWRHWVDLAAAEAWIEFVGPFSPLVAAIVQEVPPPPNP